MNTHTLTTVTSYLTGKPKVSVTYPIPEIPVNYSDPRFAHAMYEYIARVGEQDDVQRFINQAPQAKVHEWMAGIIERGDAKLRLDAKIAYAEESATSAEKTVQTYQAFAKSMRDQLDSLRKERKKIYG
jgi:hypothetical protein